MHGPISTPRPPLAVSTPATSKPKQDQILSSSPGFGTPAYPIKSRPAKPSHPLVRQSNNNVTPSVLPILLPAQTLRPVAFRTLTKKHNLTLTSSGLRVLSTFVGRFCGSGWREEGLAERALDEVAKVWKRSGGGVLVEDGRDKNLTSILRMLEPCMSAGRIDVGRLSRTNSNLSGSGLSRQNSFDIRPAANRDDSQTSLGLSGTDVGDDIEAEEDHELLSTRDARTYMTVIPAFKQPRLMYSTTKKSLETISTPPSLMPTISRKIAIIRDRYHMVHQRIMRNDSFQTPSFSVSRGGRKFSKTASNAATVQQAYKVTPISNLMGRSGSSHLLLGMLAHAPAGDLALADLTGSVVLDLSSARPVPEDGAWFCPGMMVLIEGVYEEDGSNNSALGGAGGVGGQIKGKFVGDTIAGPPAERRELSLGTGSAARPDNVSAAGFGWVDFLGTGSEKAIGAQMRRIQTRLLGTHARSEVDAEEHRRTKVAIIGECNLDNPRTLDAIRAILSSYNATGKPEDRPLSVVLMGNFVSAASCAGSVKGGGSVEYKEYFDALASTLSEFPALLANCSFVFVPGDYDPWPSAFSAGASVAIPREGVPEIFTTRIRRAFATANNEAGRKEGEGGGEAVWATNPARISMFGPVDEVVLFRDDITGRMRRSAVVFPKLPTEDLIVDEQGAPSEPNDNDDSQQQSADTEEPTHPDHYPDPAIETATSHLPAPPSRSNTTTIALSTPSNTHSARKLIKTLLDQSHLSPFPFHKRPVFWDYASSLSLYPLPTALVLCEPETGPFALTYEGCHVMNPGRVLDGFGARKGRGVWVEYDIKRRRGEVREVRF